MSGEITDGYQIAVLWCCQQEILQFPSFGYAAVEQHYKDCDAERSEKYRSMARACTGILHHFQTNCLQTEVLHVVLFVITPYITNTKTYRWNLNIAKSWIIFHLRS